ncbi:hypothetical protein [Amycolatopsis thermoflava]|uniref:Uncharacterized protein n=1 Tax=Amycolatopsis thermoflava TaxID=84480 RepID=A0A3N2GPW3_9PSEU|nr:hypothetical protein [Amycolatopsis thermoflava]ROS38664.1 hypothetical protein EDD35_0948 [Amycolatopsis thermoflava]
MARRRSFTAAAVGAVVLVVCVILGFRIYPSAPWFLPVASSAVLGVLLRIRRERGRPGR